MRELSSLRADVARTLRSAGITVVAFEDLGGRDEDSARAYLDGVARSDIYVGIVGDRYGTMLDNGRSPTHQEFLEAQRLGKRVSFWLRADARNRQGHAADFVQEVQAFHTTGQFDGAEDLAQRLLQRLEEIAADDEAPWLKIGDACFRASRIQDHGDSLTVHAEVRDPLIVDYLEATRPDQFGRGEKRPVVTTRRAGACVIKRVVTDQRSTSVFELDIAADVEWMAGGYDHMASTYNGFSPEQQTEIGLRAGLFGLPVPERLANPFGISIDTSDPLAALDPLMLPPSAMAAVGRLLLAERLVMNGRASRIVRCEIGPPNRGAQRVLLEYVAPRVYANSEPQTHLIEGDRRVG